jgi:hypothetical protein
MHGPWTATRFASFSLHAGAAMLSLLVWAAAPALGTVPCDGWALVPTPNQGNSVTRLTSVAALSADDAWAVGYWRSEPAGAGPYALRWNGSTWSETDLPDTGQLGTSPEVVGVDAAANGDVWIVGSVTTPAPTNNEPLVLRWRGGDWDIVETVTLRPQTEFPYAARGGFLDDVAILTADDVWAVGIANGFGDAESASVPLAVHWDGSSWTDVEVPLVANRHHAFYAVAAIAPDDVWAVGDYRNIGGVFRGVAYHWDGSAWSHVPSPIESVSQSALSDVVALGPNDVWAVGGSDSGPFVMHWNGSQWDVLPPPPDSGDSIAAVGPDDIWVSGWNGFHHWDGQSWTEVPAAVPGATYVIRSGGLEIVGDCDIWCVGFWAEADGITSYTLAERLQAQPTGVAEVQPLDHALQFPNPFSPGSSIRLVIPAEQSLRLVVYDLRGRRVRSLAENSSASGSRSLTWDGRNEAGRRLPAGLYFLNLELGGQRTSRKLILLGDASGGN